MPKLATSGYHPSFISPFPRACPVLVVDGAAKTHRLASKDYLATPTHNLVYPRKTLSIVGK